MCGDRSRAANAQDIDQMWLLTWDSPKSEYDVLPAWRRKLERIYRHPLGLALYYPVELWWKRLLFPTRR